MLQHKVLPCYPKFAFNFSSDASHLGPNGLLVALNKQSLLISSPIPFGYLKGTANGAALFVLPFNFPVLFALLKEYRQRSSTFNVSAWRQKWEEYLKSMPIYYAPFLKTALIRFLNSNLSNTPFYSEIFETMSGMNYGMQQSLNSLIQEAKADADRREMLRLKEATTQSTDMSTHILLLVIRLMATFIYLFFL